MSVENTSIALPKNKLPKRVQHLFACRFACDYANDSLPVLAINAIQNGKMREIIHPGNFGSINNQGVLSILSKQIQKRRLKIVHTIESHHILSELLGLSSLNYEEQNSIETCDAGESATWYEYSPIDSFDINDDVALFARNNITLLRGYEEQLLGLLNRKG